MFLCFRNCTAFKQTLDFGRTESELPKNLVVMFSNLWGALGRHFGHSMYLKRAADSGRQLAAGALERNDDVIRPELGIIDHFLRPSDGSERHVNTIEHRVPMGHRFGTKDLVE